MYLLQGYIREDGNEIVAVWNRSQIMETKQTNIHAGKLARAS